MSVVALTVTEFSRGLSDFLSQVQYQGQSLDIQRGKRVVARVLPAVASSGFPIDQLDDLLANGPQLKGSERLAMAADVRAVRSGLKSKSDPWAS
jgi:vacuolar-type H+-ATPase subunit B/Vma2